MVAKPRGRGAEKRARQGWAKSDTETETDQRGSLRWAWWLTATISTTQKDCKFETSVDYIAVLGQPG